MYAQAIMEGLILLLKTFHNLEFVVHNKIGHIVLLYIRLTYAHMDLQVDVYVLSGSALQLTHSHAAESSKGKKSV